MPAATSGYRTIGDSTPPAPPPPSGSATSNAKDASSKTPVEHVQDVARGAGSAAIGAKDAVTQLITGPIPSVNLYTEPLNPHAQMNFRDRAQLMMESCRPWSEFFDPRAFCAPEALEVKLRIAHNVEIFFYNYVIVGLGLLILFALFHPIRALLLLMTIVVGTLLYILFPEDYKVTENFSITKPMKHVLMVVWTLFILTKGGVFNLLFWVFMTFLPVMFVHAFFREHSADGQSSI